MLVYVNYSLHSLNGVIYGTFVGLTKADTRSLDYSSYRERCPNSPILSLGFGMSVVCQAPLQHGGCSDHHQDNSCWAAADKI